MPFLIHAMFHLVTGCDRPNITGRHIGGQTARKSLASAPNLTLQRDLRAGARVVAQNNGGAEMHIMRPRRSTGEAQVSQPVMASGLFSLCLHEICHLFVSVGDAQQRLLHRRVVELVRVAACLLCTPAPMRGTFGGSHKGINRQLWGKFRDLLNALKLPQKSHSLPRLRAAAWHASRS